MHIAKHVCDSIISQEMDLLKAEGTLEVSFTSFSVDQNHDLNTILQMEHLTSTY